MNGVQVTPLKLANPGSSGDKNLLALKQLVESQHR